MKSFALGALLALSSVQAFAADVGVSVTVGEPGFYGQIEIGSAPPPEVIFPRPVVIEGRPGDEPIYLRVRPGYEKHWRKHCHEYNACGRPVFFVSDDWYRDVYARHYREHRGEYREHREDYDERHEDRDERDEHREHHEHRHHEDHGDQHEDRD